MPLNHRLPAPPLLKIAMATGKAQRAANAAARREEIDVSFEQQWEKIMQVEGRVDAVQLGQRYVVQISQHLESLYQKEVVNDGGQGWRAFKAAAGKALAKEVAAALKLEYPLQPGNALSSCVKGLEVSLSPRWLLNVVPLTRRASGSDGGWERREGDFRLDLRAGLGADL